LDDFGDFQFNSIADADARCVVGFICVFDVIQQQHEYFGQKHISGLYERDENSILRRWLDVFANFVKQEQT
jgi:hypothetical protein